MTTKLVILIVAVFIIAGFAFGSDDHLNQGISLCQQGKLDEAIVELKAAVEANPKDALAARWLGSAFMNAGRYADALPYLKAAVELAPDNLVSRQQLAVTLEKNADLPGAIEQAKKVVELAPKEAGWWSYLGELLAKTGNTAEAVQNAQKAVELDPKNEYYVRNLGIRQLQNQDTAGAETSLKAAVALDAGDHYAHAWLAEVYRIQGKIDEAAAEIEAAEAAKPKQSGNEAARPPLVFKETAPTWDPAETDVTKAFIAADGDYVHVFTEARVGYQVCMKGFRLSFETKGESPSIRVTGALPFKSTADFPPGSVVSVSGDSTDGMAFGDLRVYGRGLFIPRDSEILKELLSRGSVYIFRGKASIWGYDFDSDAAYPLTFKVTSAGLVRLCGRGTVIAKGKTERLGYDDSFEKWLPLVASSTAEVREGAACALGWLAKTPAEKDEAVPALVGALQDESVSVRRFASEALAGLADLRGMRPLIALQVEPDADKWTQWIAQESLGLLKVQVAAPKLPDKVALNALKTCLEDEWTLVRRSAAQSLAKAGPDAVTSLIEALKDYDSLVRKYAAESLGLIGDARAEEPLKKAMADEKNADAKAAMEAVIGKLGK